MTRITGVAAAAAIAIAVLWPAGHAGAKRDRCRTPELRLDYAGAQGAAGTMFENLRLIPRRGLSCTLRGYPGVTLLDHHAKALSIHVRRERGDNVKTHVFSHRKPARFAVAHPSFDPKTTKPCRRKVYGFAVIPPAETRALTVSFLHATRFCRADARVTTVRHTP